MAAEETQQYTITWTAKPLGFSIVMDTTGRNAYVSSIQKQENLKKGLKLAAQIIKINGNDAKQKKHGAILDLIKNAVLPMTLTFQPRSFANSSTEETSEKTSESAGTPDALLFGGAPESAANRVDGMFLKVKNTKCNGRDMWQRKDEETDPIVLWYWPLTGGDEKDSGMQEDLWMISRASQKNSQNAYACCPSDLQNPLKISRPWKVWNKEQVKFVECKLTIADEVNDATDQNY